MRCSACASCLFGTCWPASSKGVLQERTNITEEVIRVSFSAVTCQTCPVKARCTRREKHKGRILTLSPQPIHEARERRRAEQSTSAFRASLCLAGWHRRHDVRRTSLSWAAPGALSWSTKDAAASPGHRGGHQRGKASVSCCNARSLDSRPDPSVLCLRLHVCDCARRHDVRTNFPAESFIRSHTAR